ncbi:unnamed protein product [Protopolystoma xenopodis]|uniref:Uncharacterized protein n=1 Tax=Protopolystoma xenopodis TaxID=117903 RepID=A0A448XIW6_9PLAT|nr:unnamed protein product [Protopolystoma xenopodis]
MHLHDRYHLQDFLPPRTTIDPDRSDILIHSELRANLQSATLKLKWKERRLLSFNVLTYKDFPNLEEQDHVYTGQVSGPIYPGELDFPQSSRQNQSAAIGGAGQESLVTAQTNCHSNNDAAVRQAKKEDSHLTLSCGEAQVYGQAHVPRPTLMGTEKFGDNSSILGYNYYLKEQKYATQCLNENENYDAVPTGRQQKLAVWNRSTQGLPQKGAKHPNSGRLMKVSSIMLIANKNWVSMNLLSCGYFNEIA